MLHVADVGKITGNYPSGAPDYTFLLKVHVHTQFASFNKFDYDF